MTLGKTDLGYGGCLKELRRESFGWERVRIGAVRGGRIEKSKVERSGVDRERTDRQRAEKVSIEIERASSDLALQGKPRATSWREGVI
jgi:hypothetical protein